MKKYCGRSVGYGCFRLNPGTRECRSTEFCGGQRETVPTEKPKEEKVIKKNYCSRKSKHDCYYCRGALRECVLSQTGTCVDRHSFSLEEIEERKRKEEAREEAFRRSLLRKALVFAFLAGVADAQSPNDAVTTIEESIKYADAKLEELYQ